MTNEVTDVLADADWVYVITGADLQTFEVSGIATGKLSTSQAQGPIAERLRAMLQSGST